MLFSAIAVDLETVILSEVSQEEKDKQQVILLICGNQKKGTNEIIYKTQIELQMKKTNSWFPGLSEEGNKLGEWDDIHTLLCIKRN